MLTRTDGGWWENGWQLPSNFLGVPANCISTSAADKTGALRGYEPSTINEGKVSLNTEDHQSAATEAS